MKQKLLLLWNLILVQKRKCENFIKVLLVHKNLKIESGMMYQLFIFLLFSILENGHLELDVIILINLSFRYDKKVG